MKPKLIYIVSPRYSGSTLLSFLFACHPDVATIGERKKFYTKAIRGPVPGDTENANQCSCGQPFLECEYWQDLKNELASRLDESKWNRDFPQFKAFKNKKLNYFFCRWLESSIARNRRPFWIPGYDRVRKMAETNGELIRIVLEKEGKATFVDSSKPIRQAIMLSLLDEFELTIVNLLRDPRAQISSALKYNPWTLEKATQNLLDECRLNKRIFQTFPPKKIDLAYETLCRNPELVMNRVFDFCGMTKDVEFNIRGETRHIMGNAGTRLGTDLKIVERKDWQNRLSESQVAFIGNECQELFQDLDQFDRSFEDTAK